MNFRKKLLKKINSMEKDLAMMRKFIEEESSDDTLVKLNSTVYDLAVEGIPEKLFGRKCLIECLKYMETHGEVSIHEMQEFLADKYDKKSNAINRNLKYAIEYAWKHEAKSIQAFDKQPTIVEFLKYWYKNS